MRTITTKDGTQMYYRDWGSGQPVVLSRGWPLSAALYVESQSQEPAAELLKLGGASAIISTATSGEAMSAVRGGLAVNGTLLLIGVAESMQVSPPALIPGNRSMKGWYCGTAIDSQDTLAFSARTGVRSMNEIIPLERVSEGYDRMMSGKARFGVVLRMQFNNNE